MATTKYPLVDVPWFEARAEAIARAFGKSTTVFHIMQSHALMIGAPPIHVHVWPDKLGPGKTLLVTEGLSDAQLFEPNGKKAGFRIELLTIAGKDPTDVAAWLRHVAEAMVLLYDCRFMSLGHTLALSNPPEPFAADSYLTRAALLMPPTPIRDAGEQLFKLKIEGQQLLTMWCAPLSEGELGLLKTVGDEGLCEILERDALVTDFQRPELKA